jgi:hypothetical protein
MRIMKKFFTSLILINFLISGTVQAKESNRYIEVKIKNGRAVKIMNMATSEAVSSCPSRSVVGTVYRFKYSQGEAFPETPLGVYVLESKEVIPSYFSIEDVNSNNFDNTSLNWFKSYFLRMVKKGETYKFFNYGCGNSGMVEVIDKIEVLK